MPRFVVSACCLALLGIGIFVAAEIITGAPAFSASERRNGIFGDWRVSPGASLYDRSEYYLQLGYGFLNADGLARDRTEAAGESGADEDANGRSGATEKAVEFLEQSVSLAPGNTHAWAWLAWAYAAQGDRARAREALEASWRLAPYHVRLAITRLTCFEVIMAASGNGDLDPDNEITRTGVRRDLDALARFNRSAFRQAMAHSDILKLYRPAN